MFYRNLRDLSGQMLIFLACGAIYKGNIIFAWNAVGEGNFEFFTTYTRYLHWFSSAAGEEIFGNFTTYTRDLHWFRAPQARFFWQFHHLYKGFTLIFGRRRRENFGILDRLHKGFTPILERRRREIFWNLQEHFENCRTFKQPFWHRRTFQLLNFENRRKPWIVEHIQHSFWES